MNEYGFALVLTCAVVFLLLVDRAWHRYENRRSMERLEDWWAK